MKLNKLSELLNEDSYEVFKDPASPNIKKLAIIDQKTGHVKNLGMLGGEIAKIFTSKMGNQIMNAKKLADQIAEKIRLASNDENEPSKSDLEISGDPTQGLSVIVKNEDGTIFANWKVVKDATQGSNLYKIVSA